jgi:protocatechuate 3,4-dioxygenase beta subunit
MYKKALIVLPLIIIFILTGILSSFPDSDVNAQIIITLLPIATATRTPTPINIGNFVWDDIDKDGRQDPGEPGLSGVTVQLWNSAKSQLIDSTTTDVNGNYSVIAPTPGNYRIRVVLPNILDDFSPKDNAAAGDLADSDINPDGVDYGFTDVFNLASNVISTTIYDGGIIKYRAPTATRTPTPISIGNFVWDDLDQDGRQDAGEPGLANVIVQLWNSAKTQLIASTTTNGSGNYTVVAPIPGDYRIRVVLPGIMDSFSPKDQAGGDNTLDSDINPSGPDTGFTDIFNLASNVISTTLYDAGIIIFRTPTATRTPTPISIGNFVWHDLDLDGIQDIGEPGVPGITVQLWNAEKTSLIHSTITNSSGIYTLVAPLPGDYRVRMVPFPGSSFSPKDQGVDDTKDSDITNTIISSNYGYTDIFTIASNVISITSFDAGLDYVGSTSTPTLALINTASPTQTPTRTPTLQFSLTPQPDYPNKVFLPILSNGP